MGNKTYFKKLNEKGKSDQLNINIVTWCQYFSISVSTILAGRYSECNKS